MQPCCFLLRCCFQAEGKTRLSITAYCTAPVSLMETGWDQVRRTTVEMYCLYDKQMAFWTPRDYIQQERWWLSILAVVMCEL